MTNSSSLKPGWKTWRFDQIAINVNDRIDDPSKAGVEYYVGLEHLDPDSLKIRRWGKPDDVEATKLCFKKGDIIFARRRAYQRKLGVAEFDGICSAHAMVLRPRTDVVLPEFLPFFMQSDLFMQRAVEISVGSLSPTINWKTMAMQQFGLPALEEQQRIAATFMALVEARESERSVAISAQKLLLSTLEEIWWNSKCRALSLGQLSSHITSGSRGWAEHYASDGSSLFLRITNMQRRTPHLDLSDLQKVNPPNTLESTRTRVVSGDVLLSITAELGLVAVIPNDLGEAYVNQHLALVRINPSLAYSKYVAWYLCSPTGQRQIARYNDSGAKAGMNLKNVATLRIPMVEIDKQVSMASQLELIYAASTDAIAREECTAAIQNRMSLEIFGGSNG